LPINQSSSEAVLTLALTAVGVIHHTTTTKSVVQQQ